MNNAPNYRETNRCTNCKHAIESNCRYVCAKYRSEVNPVVFKKTVNCFHVCDDWEENDNE